MGEKYNVFIGSYGSIEEETIHWLRFDTGTGKFEQIYSLTGIENPIFIKVNHAKTHLYAVSELDKGEIVSYLIDYEAEKLVELNRQSLNFRPGLLEIDKEDQYLFVANNSGGGIALYSIQEGAIGECLDQVKHDSRRFTSSVHAIKNIPGTDRYAVADLGHDEMKIYQFKDDKLHFMQDFLVADHSSPRIIAFKEDLQMMYVLGQDDSNVFVYHYDEQCEEFSLVQILATVLENDSKKNYASDLKLTSSHLYVSNCGHHSMTAYEIKEDGRLDVMGSLPSGGECPRSFGVTPDEKWLLTANEQSNHLFVMKVHENGLLEHTAIEYKVNRPACVEFGES